MIRKRSRVYTILSAVLISSVQLTAVAEEIKTVVVEELAALPEAVSNNAIALLPSADGPVLFSMQGLAQGRQWSDIHNKAWMLEAGTGNWKRLADVPGAAGRLAGVAAVAAGRIWLFGGYTVAKDGAEVSSPTVFSYIAQQREFLPVGEMPVPVDDMTAFTYQDRYIYLVSGWHDLGNVNLVQIFDTHDRSWSQATPYPGAAVFGHAGGMVGDRMLICDGVKIRYPSDGSARQFVMSDECWQGTVTKEDYRRIAWKPVPKHPGLPRYRMAATGDNEGAVVFSGGSTNPYNYDGIGYNGQPSEPEAGIMRFDFSTSSWQMDWQLPEAGMDYRGLLLADGWFYQVGGMLARQQLTARVMRWKFPAD